MKDNPDLLLNILVKIADAPIEGYKIDLCLVPD